MWTIEPMSERWVNGFRQALDAVAREGRYLALEEAPSLMQVAQFVDMLKRFDCPQVVAVDDKRVVGWADIRPLDETSERHAGELGMGVIASHRRRGIGRAVLDAVLASSRFARVELSVIADNEAAIHLYEARGFEHEGRKRSALKLGDRYVDVLLMSRVEAGRL